MLLRPLLAVPAVLAVLITGGLTAATATTAASPPTDHPAKVSASQARAALADARAVLSGAKRGDATIALRDLWAARPALIGADRAAADRLLARPDDGNPGAWATRCTTDICYHWRTSGPEAATPDYVDQVVRVVDGVHDTYAAAGYREPKPDGTAGGDSRLDIYLENVYDEQKYGYCTSDMPNPPRNGPFDAWAYCVLDNDYAEFPAHTPLENLQVTAAHEYFHAVQFAYDAFEDAWLMEATATWAEDELFDDVDDNVQYLPESQLTKPGLPLDTFNDDGAQYGSWIFFRFLTEQLDDTAGGLPTLVRDIWRRADGARGGPDDYSVQAVSRALSAYDVTLPTAYAAFATANRAPGIWYEEGADNRYPSIGPDTTVRLSKAKRSGGASGRLRHLTSATARFLPTSGLSASSWKLKLSLDLADKATGSAAVVTVYPRSGRPKVIALPVSSSGAASRTVPFGSTAVKYVEVTLVNASSRYRCWTGGAYACQGSSRDDRSPVVVRAKAVR